MALRDMTGHVIQPLPGGESVRANLLDHERRLQELHQWVTILREEREKSDAELEALRHEIVELRQTKADRAGRKPKGGRRGEPAGPVGQG